MRELRALQGKDLERASARAAAGFTVHAERGGLVDVAFAQVPSPFGDLLVAATRRGLVRLAYPNEEREAALAQLARLVSPRVLEAPARLDEIRRELEEYFDRRRDHFEFDVDFALTRGFTRKVLRATSRIPFGSVSTYRDVAGRAGNVRASRAAGNALGSNPIPIVVPCHRVVHSSGGLDRKRFLLSLEGAL